MGLPTLEQFLANPKLRNSYVRYPGIKQLYVRKGQRFLNGQLKQDVLDIANVEVAPRCRGKGRFTALIQMLGEKYSNFTIYVESVLNPRLPHKLVELGFVQVGDQRDCSPCFVKWPQEDCADCGEPIKPGTGVNFMGTSTKHQECVERS